MDLTECGSGTAVDTFRQGDWHFAQAARGFYRVLPAEEATGCVQASAWAPEAGFFCV
jgi:hypothetical protein